MTKKRFYKLCMGLGIQKKDADYCYRTFFGQNQRKFNMAFVLWTDRMDAKHPVYKRKFNDACMRWAEGKMSDGDAVKIVGRCYQATKNMIVLDRRKN